MRGEGKAYNVASLVTSCFSTSQNNIYILLENSVLYLVKAPHGCLHCYQSFILE